MDNHVNEYYVNHSLKDNIRINRRQLTTEGMYIANKYVKMTVLLLVGNLLTLLRPKIIPFHKEHVCDPHLMFFACVPSVKHHCIPHYATHKK